jgi:hypothetical protein
MRWLPLSEKSRNKFNEVKFIRFMFTQKDKEYDISQAIKAGVYILDILTFDLKGPTINQEDFGKLFCSELVAVGLKKAGVLPMINASGVTPIELCRLNIYQVKYHWIKTEKKQIK